MICATLHGKKSQRKSVKVIANQVSFCGEKAQAPAQVNENTEFEEIE